MTKQSPSSATTLPALPLQSDSAEPPFSKSPLLLTAGSTAKTPAESSANSSAKVSADSGAQSLADSELPLISEDRPFQSPFSENDSASIVAQTQIATQASTLATNRAATYPQLPTDCYGYVYRVTNTLNSKTYIGQHRHRPGEKWNTYLGSGLLIVAAVKKHGKLHFQKELLQTASSAEELNLLETHYIAEERAKGRAEYNISQGGDFFTPEDQSERTKALWETEEYREAQSSSRKKYWAQPKAKAKQSAAMSKLWEKDSYRAQRAATLAAPELRARIAKATSYTKQSNALYYSARYTLRSHESKHVPKELSLSSCGFCVIEGRAPALSTEAIEFVLGKDPLAKKAMSAQDRGRVRELAKKFQLSSASEITDHILTAPKLLKDEYSPL